MPDDGHAEALRVLEHEGLIVRAPGDEPPRTTRRWQGALARAALRLIREGQTEGDLRLPVTFALLDLLGRRGLEIPDAQLAELVEALLPLEHPVLH